MKGKIINVSLQGSEKIKEVKVHEINKVLNFINGTSQIELIDGELLSVYESPERIIKMMQA